jgi:hypothetical protein
MDKLKQCLSRGKAKDKNHSCSQAHTRGSWLLQIEGSVPHPTPSPTGLIHRLVKRGLKSLKLDLSTGNEVLNGDGLKIYINSNWNDNHLPVEKIGVKQLRFVLNGLTCEGVLKS